MNGKKYHVLGWKDLILKRSVLPKLIYEFNVVPLLKPIGFPPPGTGQSDFQIQVEK